MSAFDVAKYTAGSSKAGLNLHSQTIQAVTEELITRRKQFKKAKLRWRVSNPKSAKKSLGWIPFKASAIKVEQGQIKYGKQWFGLWDSYNLSRYTIKRWLIASWSIRTPTTTSMKILIQISIGLLFGNNSSNRKRFHIVWEKKYRLGQATVPLKDYRDW